MKYIALLFILGIMTVEGSGQTCLSGDCLNGYSKCSYTDPVEYTFEGNFVNGRWQGEGKLEIKNGYTYTGSFTNHAVTGNGTMVYPNGDKYVGNVVDGNLEGSGIYTTLDGHIYEGEFTEGRLNGYGTCIDKDGFKYEGSFGDSKFNGYGEAQYTDGTYKGYWVNNMRQGSGKYYNLSGDLMFDGTWENDEPIEGQNYSESQSDLFDKIDKAFARCYNGYEEETIYEQEGQIDLRICFYLARDYSFTAICTSTISIDGISYKCKANLAGNYNMSNHMISYHETSVISEDELPYDLVWVHGSYGSGNVNYDSEHDGYYFIKGTTSEGNNFELFDYY